MEGSQSPSLLSNPGIVLEKPRLTGVEPVNGCAGQQQGFLQVLKRQKDDEEKHGPSAEWDRIHVTKDVDSHKYSEPSLTQSLSGKLAFRNARPL